MDLEDPMKKRFEELMGAAETKETTMRYHETKAQNTAVAYLIWESLFAFGMSHYFNSSPLDCSHWWALLGFGLSGSFLYLLFFLKALIMFFQAHNHLVRISTEQIRISQLIMDGFGVDYSILVVQVYEYHSLKIILYTLFTLSALLSVNAFQLSTSYYSLCNN